LEYYVDTLKKFSIKNFEKFNSLQKARNVHVRFSMRDLAHMNIFSCLPNCVFKRKENLR